MAKIEYVIYTEGNCLQRRPSSITITEVCTEDKIEEKIDELLRTYPDLDQIDIDHDDGHHSALLAINAK